MNVAYIAMRMDRPPFDKPEVRLAMNYAVDNEGDRRGPLQRLRHAGREPAFRPACGATTRKVTGLRATTPAKAKSLLAQAGVAAASRPSSGRCRAAPLHARAAQGGRGDPGRPPIGGHRGQIAHARVGHVSRLHPAPQARVPACIGWTGDNGDPDNFLYVLLDKESAGCRPRTLVLSRATRCTAADRRPGGAAIRRAAPRSTSRRSRSCTATCRGCRSPTWMLLAATRKNVPRATCSIPPSKLRLARVWIEPAS